MLFNSLEYLLFLPAVFLLHWFIFNRTSKSQNLILLISSFVFYGWWDWRFLSLIIFSTVLDYFIGLEMHKSEDDRKRKWLLRASVVFNLGLLGFFKYFNFFVDSFIEAFASAGVELDPLMLSIILPVGISFYTFQTMSYTLDIQKYRLEPTKDFIAFATFVSFFPQLVAGPIERASNLLPQMLAKRKFNYAQAVDGSRQILWGLFKKMVIADNCAPYVTEAFTNYGGASTSFLILGVVLFAFQVYCDFSGYSDIAIGTAKLFNVKFKANFNYPYFSKSISEFWKRWHISLSSWLNDYVFTPMALHWRDYAKWGVFFALFMTFIISGFWHGAGWNYVFWGGLHGFYYIPVFLRKKRFSSISSSKSMANERTRFIDVPRILLTFVLVLITYIFFRASSLPDGFGYFEQLFTAENFALTKKELFLLGTNYRLYYTLSFIGLLIVLELFLKSKTIYPLELMFGTPKWLRWIIYMIIISTILMFMTTEKVEFIYFQF